MIRGAWMLFISVCTGMGAARVVQEAGLWLHWATAREWGALLAVFVCATTFAYLSHLEEQREAALYQCWTIRNTGEDAAPPENPTQAP